MCVSIYIYIYREREREREVYIEQPRGLRRAAPPPRGGRPGAPPRGGFFFSLSVVFVFVYLSFSFLIQRVFPTSSSFVYYSYIFLYLLYSYLFPMFGRLARPRVWSCTSAQRCAIAQWLKGTAAPTPRTHTKSVHEFYCTGGKWLILGEDKRGNAQLETSGLHNICIYVCVCVYIYTHTIYIYI